MLSPPPCHMIHACCSCVARSLGSLGAHSRWEPGTERLVMNMVAQRSKNTEPDKAQNLLIAIDLCLWKNKMIIHVVVSKIIVISHNWNAHEICGTLSRNISGNGGWRSLSGTRSCTKTMTMAVIQVTSNMYRHEIMVLTYSGWSWVAIPLGRRRLPKDWCCCCCSGKSEACESDE